MLHVDWKTESYGARNGHPGEYDTVLYFTVWLGVPVYFSFRRCVHVIELAKVGPGERLECLRGFAKTYLGIADLTPHLSGTLHLPLRPLGSLKRLVIYDQALWLLSSSPVLAIVAIYHILRQPGPLTLASIAFRVVSGGGITDECLLHRGDDLASGF
jgi:hypothetical protein